MGVTAGAGAWFLSPLSGLGEPKGSPLITPYLSGVGCILVLTDRIPEAFPRKSTPQARRRAESPKHSAFCDKQQTESESDSRQA